MPTSRPYGISYIASCILELQPTSVLDIGVGFGKYGFMAREYTDIWKNRHQKSEWKTIIHGIEAYSKYITHHQYYIYTKIFIADVIKILPGLGEYDLITFGDCLEHFSRENGIKLLDMIKSKCKVAFITTPTLSKFQTRGAMKGNEYEKHVYGWPTEELERWGNVQTFNNHINLLEIINE